MPAFVVAIAVAVGLVVLLFNIFPEQRFSNLESSQLVYMAGVLVLVLSSVLIRFRSNFSSSVKSLATWCVILIVLVSAYSYRNEFDTLLGRIHAQLVPSSPVVSQAGEVSFRPQGRGGFVVDAEVNGVPLRFVVDTGADIVTLTEADAERLGFNIEELSFREPFISPGGEGMAAKVLLDEIKIGSIVKHNVVAHIVRGSLDVSLLGMNYIGRIDRVTLTPDGMTFIDSET